MKKNIAVMLLLLTALPLTGCSRGEKKQSSVTGAPVTDNTFVREEDYSAVLAAAQAGVELETGLYLMSLRSYTGVYPENDAREYVENTAAATLVNLSPVAYRYLEFTVTADEAEYTFFVTTLPVGGRITVAEKNRAPFAGAQNMRARVTSVEPFPNQPSLHPESLRLAYGEETVFAENISGETLRDVCVYYKTVDENGYLGGITYRVRLGDVAAGETARSAAPGLGKTTGKIVFATIGQSEE